MRCEECPISLVCFAGQLTHLERPMPETYLCPYCGNFRTPAFEEDETRDEYKAGLLGFQCEQRRMDERLKEQWKYRSLGANMSGMHRYNDVRLEGDFIKALRVDDPGPGDKLWIKPCTFCRH